MLITIESLFFRFFVPRLKSMKTRILHTYYQSLFSLFFIAISCISCGSKNEKHRVQKQNYFISNIECDNSNSFTYVFVNNISQDTLFFGPDVDYLLNQIDDKWTLGQGTNSIYYDTGKEYLFSINIVNTSKRYIVINNSKSFNISKPVVFWNTKINSNPVFPNSSGSWSFGKIIYDSTSQQFVSHIFPCDTNKVNIFLATTSNLIDWKVTEKPIISAESFNGIFWNAPNNNKKMMVAPLVSDVIYNNEKYYTFVYGDDINNKTYIGLLTSDSLKGKYTIHKSPLIKPNSKSIFSNHDVYFPKVIKNKKSWLMFYTAKNAEEDEVICIATSDDLCSWKTIKENIIPRNNGWNQNIRNQLTAQVKLINDTIFLWATGTKTVHDQNGSLNKGNVLDISIGKFFSINGGLSFQEIDGNPIFGGNPNSNTENDHIGGSYQEIKFQDSTFIFFHSKGVSIPNYKIKYFKK